MKEKQMSQSLPLGLLLAIAGGILDAYTYLCRGGVFATAETGNIVLFGISMASGDFARAFHYLPPILAFTVGIIIAERLTAMEQHLGLHWRQWVILIECAVLMGAAFIPEKLDQLVCILVSCISAIQVEAFRKFHGRPCATTMCTGNLRSAAELLYRKDSGMWIYLSLISAFVIGAVCCGFAVGVLGDRTVILACVPMLFGFFLMYY